MSFNPRAQTQQILRSILEDHQPWDRSFLPSDSRSHPFIQALTLGVLRFYIPLKKLLSSFLDKPLRNKDQDIEILLLMGFFEILFFDTPDYAVVNETQKAVPAKKAWAKGLLNAVLRKLIQAKAKNPQGLLEKYDFFPTWIESLIQKNYPEWKDSLIRAHQSTPPMHLRVNVQKNSREAYLKKFPELDVSVPTSFNEGLTLNTPCPVEEIPGFSEGLISVQDLAPQKTPELMELKPGLKVLDACAAPGGKSAHIWEACPQISLTCLDIHPERTQKIHENLKRLQLMNPELKVQTEDAIEFSQHCSPFDRILLDAPCSGLGVIRRHPEIALHRSPENLKELANQQLKLLTNLWPILKIQGILLYATCSIAPTENDEVIEQFLSQHADAKISPLCLSHPDHNGLQTRYGWQFLPTPQGPDGFYYSKIVKA